MNMNKVLASVAAAALVCSVGAAQAETFMFGHGLAPNHPVAVNGFDPWMACVQQKSGGELSFDYFPSGQIVTAPGTLDSLNDGVAQVGFVALSHASSKLPLSGVGMLPGMGDSAGQMVGAFRKMLVDPTPVAAEFEAARLYPVMINALPPFQVLTVVGPVREFGAFSGLKTSTAGGAMNFTVSSLGGVPVEMSAPDYYLALDRKTTDAGIMSLASVKTYNLQEVINAVSANGSFGTAVSVLSMDLDTFNALSPEKQEVVARCGLETEAALAAALTELNTRLIVEFKELGVEVYDFTPEEIAALNGALAAAGEDYVARLTARSLPAQEVFDLYRAALGQ